MSYLAYYIAFAGAWAAGNGILHTVFVLAERRPYDRDLIRLLVDGHLLVFAGIFYLLSYRGIKANEPWAFYVAIAAAVFLLGYCALIFRLLPSVGTIVINLVALVWLVAELVRR